MLFHSSKALGIHFRRQEITFFSKLRQNFREITLNIHELTRNLRDVTRDFLYICTGKTSF